MAPKKSESESSQLQELLVQLVAIEGGLKTSTVSFTKQRLHEAIERVHGMLEAQS